MCQQIKEIMNSYNLLVENIEKPIYHYTTQTGIIGIIKKKCLWASSIFYVNDDREFSLALNLLKELLNESEKIISKGDFRYWLKSLENKENILHNQHVFVCSFSDNGDQLSQWRGYCPNANGYSIGFKPSLFQNLKDGKEFRMVKCEYEPKTQDQILQRIFDKYIEERNSVVNAQQLINQYVKGILQYVCPVFKHESFKEEKESRLVYVPEASLTTDSQYFSSIQFRPGKSMIIPYVNYKIPWSDESVNLHEIVIGPTPHKDLSKASIKTLLNVDNVSCKKITISKSPYRGW